MGGLLGIPHYSKLEFIFLTFTSVGFFLTWVYDPVISFVTVLTILTGTVYLLICLFYAVFARQNKVVFTIPFLVNLVLLIWRSVRFVIQIFLGLFKSKSFLPTEIFSKVPGPNVPRHSRSLRSSRSPPQSPLTPRDETQSRAMPTNHSEAPTDPTV